MGNLMMTDLLGFPKENGGALTNKTLQAGKISLTEVLQRGSGSDATDGICGEAVYRRNVALRLGLS